MNLRIASRNIGALLVIALAAPRCAAADGEVITRWAEQSMQAVRARNVGTPDAGRLYAMVLIAMYDAVNGIDAASHHDASTRWSRSPAHQ